MRVVLDANVAIAAVASRGLCEAILELCLQHHQLVLCEALLKEIREKLGKKIKVAAPVIREFISILRSNAEIVEPEAVRKSACRDPKDLMILGMVIPGNADVIVTGDKDLLVIGKFKKARIITPREFWELSKT